MTATPLDMAGVVERLTLLSKFSGASGAFGRAVRKAHEQQLRDDLTALLSAFKARGEALAKVERRAARMEAALEESGTGQAWRDGFKACADVVTSVRVHASWGPKATPDDGIRLAINSVRETVASSVKAQEARALSPTVGGQGRE